MGVFGVIAEGARGNGNIDRGGQGDKKENNTKSNGRAAGLTGSEESAAMGKWLKWLAAFSRGRRPQAPKEEASLCTLLVMGVRFSV
jgi:hypothetical protein